MGGYAGNYDVARKRVSTGIITNNNNIASAGVRTPYSWGSDGLGESYEITVTSRRTSDPDLPAEFADYQSGSGGAFTGSPVTVTDSRNHLVKCAYFYSGWATPRREWGVSEPIVFGDLCPNKYPWGTPHGPNYPFPPGPSDDPTNDGIMRYTHGPYYDTPTDPDRQPALGFYDQAADAVMGQQIIDMEAAGFEVAIYQIGWSDKHAVGVHASELSDEAKPLISHAARYHASLPQGEAVGRLRFCLSRFEVTGEGPYTDDYWGDLMADGWTYATLKASMAEFGNRIAAMVASPHYYRVKDRPVFFVGSPQEWQAVAVRFGQTLGQYMADLKTETGQDWYYVATQFPENSPHPTLALYEFDAQSEYRYIAAPFSALQTEYNNRWGDGITQTQTPAYWPPVSTGHDNRPINDNLGGNAVVMSKEQFTTHLSDAAAFARLNHAKTAGHVVVCAWNEWTEGSVVEPFPATGGLLHIGNEMAVAAASIT